MYDEEIQQLEDMIAANHESLPELHKEQKRLYKQLNQYKYWRWSGYALLLWTIMLTIVFTSTFAIVVAYMNIGLAVIFLMKTTADETDLANFIEGWDALVEGIERATEEAQFAIIAIREDL